MITEALFLKNLAAIYCVAFTSIFIQYRGLYGVNGLNPIVDLLNKHLNVENDLGMIDVINQYMNVPTIGWLAYIPDVRGNGFDIDTLYQASILLGMVVSLVAFLGVGNKITFAILYILYLSIFSVGQSFLSFQWDLLLLEVGVLAIVYAPFLSRNHSHTSLTAIGLVRWCLFKLMLMSGVVKIQSECPTWLGLTALNYHYATQCLPTSLAWYAHQLPSILHKFSVAATLFIEIPATVLILSPFKYLRYLGGLLQIQLQIMIILTGNYTYFNWLTITLTLALFDDGYYRKVMNYFICRRSRLHLQSHRNGLKARPLIMKYAEVIATMLGVMFLCYSASVMFKYSSSDVSSLIRTERGYTVSYLEKHDIRLTLTAPKLRQCKLIV